MTDKYPKSTDSFELGKIKQLERCCVPHPLFGIKNLSISFGNELALRDVSIDIFEGCLTAIVGPSGCGKSTFLLALAQLLSLHHKVNISGSIRYLDKELYHENYPTRRGLEQIRSEVGYVFQKPTPFPTSIYKNMAIALKERGLRDKYLLEEKITTTLQKVALWDEVKDRLNKPASTLSGGQQQRLCMARTLALEPKAILMDEPASSLDPISGKIIEELILQLKGEATIILVTHNILQARRIANYLAVFSRSSDRSSLIQSGETQEIFNNPEAEIVSALLRG